MIWIPFAIGRMKWGGGGSGGAVRYFKSNTITCHEHGSVFDVLSALVWTISAEVFVRQTVKTSICDGVQTFYIIQFFTRTADREHSNAVRTVILLLVFLFLILRNVAVRLGRGLGSLTHYCSHGGAHLLYTDLCRLTFADSANRGFFFFYTPNSCEQFLTRCSRQFMIMIIIFFLRFTKVNRDRMRTYTTVSRWYVVYGVGEGGRGSEKTDSAGNSLTPVNRRAK